MGTVVVHVCCVVVQFDARTVVCGEAPPPPRTRVVKALVTKSLLYLVLTNSYLLTYGGRVVHLLYFWVGINPLLGWGWSRPSTKRKARYSLVSGARLQKPTTGAGRRIATSIPHSVPPLVAVV